MLIAFVFIIYKLDEKKKSNGVINFNYNNAENVKIFTNQLTGWL